MEESDLETVGTLARSGVDEADALLVTFSECVCYAVLDAEGYVVNALVAFV